MELNVRDLKTNMRGSDVVTLQNDLMELGFAIDSIEIEKQVFGRSTKTATQDFQRSSDLAITGVVDEATHIAIKEAADSDLVFSENFIVQGKIVGDNCDLDDIAVVKAYDKDLRHEEELGITESFANNQFRIAYQTNQFRRSEKRNADLILRAFWHNGDQASESKVLFNAPHLATVELRIDQNKPARASEIEQLIADLNPVLDGEKLHRLNAQDIQFLTAETSIDAKRIEILVASAQLARETPLAKEAFYAWGRQGISIVLDELIREPLLRLQTALEDSLDQELIPASMRNAQEDILASISLLRQKNKLVAKYSFTAQLIQQENQQALANYRVNTIDLDSELGPQNRGEQLSDRHGKFEVTFITDLATDSDSAVIKKRNIEFTVLNKTGDILHKTSVIVKLPVDKALSIAVPENSLPEIVTEPLSELAEALSLDIPDTLSRFLEKKKISTLEDVRRNGGIANLDDLPKRLASNRTVLRFDQHARLSILTTEHKTRTALIEKDYQSHSAISSAPRSEFFNDLRGELGDYAAADLHARALAQIGVMNNILGGLMGDMVPYALPLPQGTNDSPPGMRPLPPNLTRIKCSCRNCEAAVSPLAYLADLLDYAIDYLRDNGAKISLSWLNNNLNQPFSTLPTSCEEVEKRVNQVRVCIEIMRRYIAKNPVQGSKAVQLAAQEQEYLLKAYTIVLNQIGTSFNELRDIQNESSDNRYKLADRLGIHLDGISADPFAQLYLEPSNGELTEIALEKLFGLVDTQRNPFSAGQIIDDNQNQIRQWYLKGITYGQNTDSNGQIHVKLYKDNAYFKVELYSDVARTQLVAYGRRNSSYGQITLKDMNQSKLSGTIDIKYLADDQQIHLIAIPKFFSWRQQQLRTLWQQFDWPIDRYSTDSDNQLPIIDPDIINANDFRNPIGGDPAFDIWQQRYDWLSQQQQAQAALITTINSQQVPDLNAIFNSMYQPHSYFSSTQTPWNITTPSTDFPLLVDALANGVDVELATSRIEDDLMLTVDSFSRLMEIQLKDNTWSNDSTAPIVTSEEWAEVYAILARALKRVFRLAWIDEETLANISLDPKQFWISITEPELESWRASLEGRILWQQALLTRSRSPHIDPDLITLDDLQNPLSGDPAYDTFQVRKVWITNQLSTINSSSQDLSGFESNVQSILGVGANELSNLRLLEENGNSIEKQLAQLSISRPAFLKLHDVYNALLDNASVLNSEWEDVASILLQTQKQREYALWQSQEKQQGISLSPTHFVLAPTLSASFVSAQLPKWRATLAQRRDWEDTLESRINQDKTIIASRELIIDKVEEACLEQLRDALIMASNFQGSSLDEKADTVVDTFFIDAKTSTCQQTTRVAQAIEAIQNLIFATFTRQNEITYPDFEIWDEHYQQRWQWIGSYAQWRAAMFVFIYPENIAIPSLRKFQSQTQAFQTLIKETRINRHLTPLDACHAANRYARYYRDVCRLEISSSCLATAYVKTTGCKGIDIIDQGHRKLFFSFARSSVSNDFYMSYYDPSDKSGYAQSYWEPIPDLDSSNIDQLIGTVPFEKDQETRFIYLFISFNDRKDVIGFIKYDLNLRTWLTDIEELSVPLKGTPGQIVAVQAEVVNSPPLLVFRRLVGTWDKPFYYVRRMDEDGIGWEGELSDDEEPEESEGNEPTPDEWEYYFHHYLASKEQKLCAVLKIGTRPNERLLFVRKNKDALLQTYLTAVVNSSPMDWLSFGKSGFNGTQHGPGPKVSLFLRNSSSFYTQQHYIQMDPSDLSTIGNPSLVSPLAFVEHFGPWCEYIDGNPANNNRICRFSSNKGAYRVNFIPSPQHPLIENERQSVIPKVALSQDPADNRFAFDISDQLSTDQLQKKRQTMALWFQENSNDPNTPAAMLSYLEEAYFFVPIQLGLQLQRQGHYMSALAWFRSVYDYSVELSNRKIYYGLKLEETTPLSIAYQREQDWLLDPLNPHEISSTRRNAYTRFTLLAIVRCFLDFADAEFTLDNAESIPKARTLYLTALGLLDSPHLAGHGPSFCDELIGQLEIKIGGQSGLQKLVSEIKALSLEANEQTMKTVSENVMSIISGDGNWDTQFEPALNVVRAAKSDALAMTSPTLNTVMEERTLLTEQGHVSLMTQEETLHVANKAAVMASQDFARAMSLSTGKSQRALRNNNDRFDWLGDQANKGNDTSPQFELGQLERIPFPFKPKLFKFCIPPNPVLKMLRMRAEANLFKLRNCRNIAGMRREISPYAAPTDTFTGLPTIGAGGQLVLPGLLKFAPTPYRYLVLVDRAKQLTSLAQQMETSMLSAIEKADAENYSMLKAKQDVQTSRAGVRLLTLRVSQARHGVDLARKQQQRAQIQADQFQEWLDEGISTLESASLAMQMAQFLPLVAGIAAADAEFRFSKGLELTAKALATTGDILNQFASFERRAEQWQFQRKVAEQDILIGKQQVKLAKDEVKIVGQERIIANMQSDHAKATVDFLTNKFTNAELYEWMSDVLESVYRYFLQQATSMAHLASVQLGFERQEIAPPFIQTDYWQDLMSSGFSAEQSDRRGLTGSARLLQDIYQLDQFSFKTNHRKLQLSKTISLARLSPVEFQRFRETGVLQFATPMELFDQDFPGHYLRLIKRVRTSVLALVPTIDSIHATLSNSGSSRVVIGGDIYQTVNVAHGPQSIALTSPRAATGLFELDTQPDMLLPFEGLGIDSFWELRMPKASNAVDFNTLADVLITFEYTAMQSYDYQQQVILELGGKTSSDRAFSFRQQFADQWYHLHNPVGPSNQPLSVRFETRREDFPSNLENLKVEHVVMYFARQTGITEEVEVAHLHYQENHMGALLGGSASSINGVISTRRGNAGSWMSIMSKDVAGQWELLIEDAWAKSMFENQQLDDILFVITYSARKPEWPS